MNDVEILSYDGEGYDRTMHYGTWRVAIANYAERFDKELYPYLERHLLTDEVFVLLEGNVTLVTGMDFCKTPLEKGKLYNVKRGAWHAVLLEKDAKVLIVENHDTGKENTEYFHFRQ